MQEELVKQILSSYLQTNQKEFLQELHFEDCIIDFAVKNPDGGWSGIEVKGIKSNEMITLGQLVHYYQHCSHVILCAPKGVLDKFIPKLNSNPESQSIANKLGVFTINNNQIEIIKEPSNQSYYFKLPTESLRKKVYGPPKYGILDSLDEFILKLVEERGVILMGELYKILKNENKTKFSMEALRKRLKNLVYFKHLEYTSKYVTAVALP